MIYKIYPLLVFLLLSFGKDSKNTSELKTATTRSIAKVEKKLAYPKFRGDSKFSTWTYRVALNTAITLYRKTKRTISTVDYESHQHFVKDVDYNYEEEEQIKLMYKAVYQLNDIEKALVFMYLEDKDYQEIAETLGISEVNARVKMNRIKGKLKKILNP